MGKEEREGEGEEKRKREQESKRKQERARDRARDRERRECVVFCITVVSVLNILISKCTNVPPQIGKETMDMDT